VPRRKRQEVTKLGASPVLLGTVYASDEREARTAAIAKFKLDPNARPRTSASRLFSRAAADQKPVALARVRYRDAAQRLIRSPWAQQRIRLLAAALLRHGTLSGDEIFDLSSNQIVTTDQGRTCAVAGGGVRRGATKNI
jgi:hypothetical protein